MMGLHRGELLLVMVPLHGAADGKALGRYHALWDGTASHKGIPHSIVQSDEALDSENHVVCSSNWL